MTYIANEIRSKVPAKRHLPASNRNVANFLLSPYNILAKSKNIYFAIQIHKLLQPQKVILKMPFNLGTFLYRIRQFSGVCMSITSCTRVRLASEITTNYTTDCIGNVVSVATHILRRNQNSITTAQFKLPQNCFSVEKEKILNMELG